jgi:hypothetical protein
MKVRPPSMEATKPPLVRTLAASTEATCGRIRRPWRNLPRKIQRGAEL